jgi:MFS family permease
MERGASQSASGLFLAFAFLCLALGNMSPAALPKDFRHRRLLLVACGVLEIVLAWLAGRVANVLQLAIATGAGWFLAGIIFSQGTTLVGLAAGPEDRGTAFGILGMTNGLGALIGGLTVGPIADRFGYRGAYDGLAVFCVLIVVGGLISIEGSSSAAPEDSPSVPPVRRQLGGFLVLLLLAQVLVAVSNGPANLGRSLSMNAAGFSKSALTLTTAISGLISLSIPILAGRLSDRIGRRWVLVASYLLTGASLVLLSFSRVFWQFCVFAILNAFFGASTAIGPAYVVDVDPHGNVGRNVSLLGSALWVGCIAGMAPLGYAFEKLGIVTSVLITSLFPVAAAVLLLIIREKTQSSGIPTPPPRPA